MKRVLIVRLDAIGDYILWRNCLRFIRFSPALRDAHVTVLGNPKWRNLAETFDADCADEWIWAENRDNLVRRSWENLLPFCIWHARVAYTQEKLKKRLRALSFDTVISPSAYYDWQLDEFVLGIAPETIVVDNGDKTRAARFTRVLPPGDGVFEFEKNLAIASAIAGKECKVPLLLDLGREIPKTNKVLFFTSASHWTRQWPKRRWRELARLIPPGFEPVEPPSNLTLSQFAEFVASCAAVVTNDTMAHHLAAALNVPAVCIANGISGRDAFWPYPRSLRPNFALCKPASVPNIPIPHLGPRLNQYIALSSVKAPEVASALRSILEQPN